MLGSLTHIRPSISRRRWNAPAWGWLFLAVVFLGCAGLLYVPLASGITGGSSGFGFSVWLWTDGTLSDEPPQNQYGMMDSTFIKDRFNIAVDARWEIGGPHPVAGHWLVNSTHRFSSVVAVTDKSGTKVTDVAPFRLFIVEHVEGNITLQKEIPDIASRIKMVPTSWSNPWPEGRLYNRLSIARYVCVLGAVFAWFVGMLTWLSPRRGELRREYLAAGKCPRCSYSIRGLSVPTCPECGESLKL